MCGSGTGSYDLVLNRIHRTRPSFPSWSFLVVKNSDEGVLAHSDDSVWPGSISSLGATLCFERVWWCLRGESPAGIIQLLSIRLLRDIFPTLAL